MFFNRKSLIKQICIFAVIFLITALSCGCRENIEIPEEEKISVSTSVPRVTTNLIKIAYDGWSFDDTTTLLWEKYVKGTFGKDINLVIADYGSYEDEFEEVRFDGLVYVESLNTLDRMMSRNSILPLNSIEGEEPVIVGNISLFGKDSVYLEENYWMIKQTSQVRTFGRTYNADLTEGLELMLPASVDELVSFTESLNSYNQNHEIPIYFAEFSVETILENFTDLFSAYGVYYDKYTDFKNIAFNHVKDEYEDITLNENFHQALLQIKYLYDMGVLKSESDDGENNEENNIISRYGYAYDRPYENNEIMWYLKGINETHLIDEDVDSSGFVILRDSDHALEDVKCVLEGLEDNEEFMMALMFGIPDKQYYEKGDAYVIMSDGRPYYQSILGIHMDKSKLSRTVEIDDINGYLTEDNADIDKIAESLEDIHANESADMFYYKTFKMYEITRIKRTMSRNIISAFYKFIYQVIVEDVPVSDALKEYKVQYNMYMVEEELNTLNDYYRNIGY